MDFTNAPLAPLPQGSNKKAARLFTNDCKLLSSYVNGKKSIDEVDLDQLLNYLELLDTVVYRVKLGITANDNFISYTAGQMANQATASVQTTEVMNESHQSLAQALKSADGLPLAQGDSTLNLLKKDLAALGDGVRGKELEDIDFEKVSGYIAALKDTVASLKMGDRGRDHFLSYTGGLDNVEEMFAKEIQTTAGLK